MLFASDRSFLSVWKCWHGWFLSKFCYFAKHEWFINKQFVWVSWFVNLLGVVDFSNF